MAEPSRPLRPPASPIAPFALEIEPPLRLARRHELVLLRRAAAVRPHSSDLRLALARLLLPYDCFDEMIALLATPSSAADMPDPEEVLLLALAYLSRDTADDDGRAEAVLRAVLPLDDAAFQAEMLATLAKAVARQGRTAAARALLADALVADPGNVNACKRLAAIDLAIDPARALAMADGLAAQGIGHARLLLARTMALGRLGRHGEMREAAGLDRFLRRRLLDPPPGWGSRAAFHDAVRAELLAHPDLRFNRYGTASAETWRLDEPVIAGAAALPRLQALIARAVTDHVATIDRAATPWTRACPDRARFHTWCVMTDAEGHEEWHVHQNGWMSGVYYLDVPPAVARGSGRGGCIAFGMPAEQVGEAAARAFGETMVRPQPGLLMLFPSHCHHRTFPHGGEGRRICLAFDIQPV